MGMELCVLASGSGGNCTLLRTPSGCVLIDAGLAPRTTSQRLSDTGIAVGDMSAICVTHLDRDHFNFDWLETIVDQQVRVFCHADRVADVLRYAGERVSAAALLRSLEALIVGFECGQTFEPLDGLRFEAILLAHDDDGCHGFVAEGFDWRIGYATDLGHVPESLIERFCGLNVLCLESNYDPDMQTASARPEFLKRRIMGGRGHLSNRQAFEAVQRVLDRCEKRGLALPEHIVTLHRSRQCNCPKLLRSVFARDARIHQRLTLAEQFVRTAWLRPRESMPLIGEQLRLAWG
jgi:phosphoribosyl 1,2-cyclic phosphodiesterase